MNLTDLLTIIYDNQEKMLAQYPLMSKIVVDVHANLIDEVNHKLKEKKGKKI